MKSTYMIFIYVSLQVQVQVQVIKNQNTHLAWYIIFCQLSRSAFHVGAEVVGRCVVWWVLLCVIDVMFEKMRMWRDYDWTTRHDFFNLVCVLLNRMFRSADKSIWINPHTVRTNTKFEGSNHYGLHVANQIITQKTFQNHNDKIKNWETVITICMLKQT